MSPIIAMFIIPVDCRACRASRLPCPASPRLALADSLCGVISSFVCGISRAVVFCSFLLRVIMGSLSGWQVQCTSLSFSDWMNQSKDHKLLLGHSLPA